MPTSKNGTRHTKPKPVSKDFMEKLKAFVRTQGSSFLRDPNITSVGIGHKQKGGKSTDDIAIQFTVGKKVVPEALGALETNLIPPSFMIDGVEVPTDVLERSYEPAYKTVSAVSVNLRKTRINPIVPGVSVANFRVSAGTIGSIVYDRQSGTPYILSNWHVLHGPDGLVGDDIVQPGPHDDNRVEQNRVGKLVRSHLGAAGDCAVATIEDRSFNPDILELGVHAEELGEPELGDKVIKSGRTTGVTHGIVTRIHTMVRLDYGGDVGNKDIGGFEIGPDEQHPAGNGEISMGGDSGSLWLFKSASGTTTNVMAGLHFAGEGANDPNEHAMACYACSVFEKLEISLSPSVEPGTFLEAVAPRGYDPEFLGQRVTPPSLTAAGKQKAYKHNGSEVIPYTHFSLALSEPRRFAMWVAWNIDGSRLRKLSRSGIAFTLDPEIPAEFQVDDMLYAGNRLDRGHIARRADLCWGSDPEARQANRDSFYFTNITPQMDDFNQSKQNGIWGQLEDAIYADVEVDNLRVSVVGGPIFHDDDREFRGVKIPREFFKALMYLEGGQLKAKAFLLTQNIDELEVLDLDEFRVYEVTLAELEQRTDLRFPSALKAADTFAAIIRHQPEAARIRKPIESIAGIRWS